MMKENWVYCRGDIYCAKLDPVVGSEQGGIRPVIVIQNDTGNKHAPTLIVATVTTRIHKKANIVPFPVSWTVKMKKKQKETQDILSYHTQAAGCSDKARAKASGGRQPIEECGRTGL